MSLKKGITGNSYYALDYYELTAKTATVIHVRKSYDSPAIDRTRQLRVFTVKVESKVH